MRKARTSSNGNGAQPRLHQRGKPLQTFGKLARYPLALEEAARNEMVQELNPLLADTITLRDMYKKHHWQVSGPTFYALHLLYDEHAKEQTELIDMLAERVQILGGVAVAMAHDVAEMTRIERPKRDREDVPTQISRLLEAHEQVLSSARELAHRADEIGDDGTNDLLVSSIIRTNEMQVWFLSEHLVESPLVRATEGEPAQASPSRSERRATR